MLKVISFLLLLVESYQDDGVVYASPFVRPSWLGRMAGEHIPKGTVLYIEHALIKHSFSENPELFRESYLNLARSSRSLSGLFHIVMEHIPSVRSHNQSHFEMAEDPAEDPKAVSHLSGTGRLYSDVPFIRMGFGANVDLWETDGLIVIASVSDIAFAEDLVQPLDFMKRLGHTPSLSVEQWMADVAPKLSDREGVILHALKADLDEIAAVYREKENYDAVIELPAYRRVMFRMYRDLPMDAEHGYRARDGFLTNSDIELQLFYWSCAVDVLSDWVRSGDVLRAAKFRRICDSDEPWSRTLKNDEALFKWMRGESERALKKKRRVEELT